MSFLVEPAFIVLAKFKIHKDDELVSQLWELKLFVDPDNWIYKFKAKKLNVFVTLLSLNFPNLKDKMVSISG